MDELISDLRRDIENGEDYISSIKRPKMLLSALVDLNNMIGNKQLKDDVATQVDDLIDNLHTGQDEEPVMLHTLLYGGPGAGKSTIGRHLARIWYSLGYIGRNNEMKRNYKSSTDRAKAKKKDDWSEILDGLMSGDPDKFNESYMYLGMVMIVVSILSVIWSYLWSVLKSCYQLVGLRWMLIFVGVLLIISVIFFFISYIFSTPNCRKCNKSPCMCVKEKIKRNIVQKDNEEPKEEKEAKEAKEISDKEETFKDEDLITVISSEDFIGQYVGHTEANTKKILQENKGKVLFIDEAYSLISNSGTGDVFGEKALNIINRYMSEHPEDLVIIMAGYEDKIKEGLFRVQPGLVRRFMWSFDCKGYSTEELFEIWKLQLHPRRLVDEDKSFEIFKRNNDVFPNYAGDTLRLVNFVKLEQKRDNRKTRGSRSDSMQSSMLEPITPEQVKKAVITLGRNTVKSDKIADTTVTPEMMKLLNMLSKK